MVGKPGLALVWMVILSALSGAGEPAAAAESGRGSSGEDTVSIEAFELDGEMYLYTKIYNPHERALCINLNDVPGSYEVTEGPTEVFDASGRQVNRRVQEDRFAVFPPGMGGRRVLIIPPGKRWFDSYSLTEIFDLKENRKYSAAVNTHALFCELYDRGTPEDVMEDWDEYMKYVVPIVSDKAEFETGKAGAD